jgi:riboflavin kinase / FMN adenylyltransferase
MPKVRGLVVHGEGQGRSTGYPTANLKVEPGSFRPHPGVYLAWVDGADQPRHPSLLVSGVAWDAVGVPRIEVYLLDVEVDLYGRELTVEIGKRLRDAMRFSSPEALVQQIEADVAAARKFNSLSRP